MSIKRCKVLLIIFKVMKQWVLFKKKSRNMHKMALVTKKCHKSCEIYLKNIKNNLVIQIWIWQKSMNIFYNIFNLMKLKISLQMKWQQSFKQQIFNHKSQRLCHNIWILICKQYLRRYKKKCKEVWWIFLVHLQMLFSLIVKPLQERWG